MDAAEYKHVVLGLIFLKYISDAFSPDGRALCRGELPLAEDVYEIGRDYLLTHERDSLGVETVVQYRTRGGE